MAFLRKNKQSKPTQAPAAPIQPAKPKEPEKTIFVWKAPARPYKKRTKEYYTTIASIVFLVAIILLFLKEWLLIAVIISLTFLSYVLASVKPASVKHKITTWGIITGDKKYKWESLTAYWFSYKFSNTLLNIKTKLSFPGQLIMLVENDKEKVNKILEKYLVREKPAKTFIDKSAEWLQKKVPLETNLTSTPSTKKV